MSKPDEARRAFLVGTAVGAGVAAGAALVPEAFAKTRDHQVAENAAASAPASAHAGMSGGHGAFFNDDDSETIAALTERIMPGAPGKPGAREAGVLNYIDLALSGAYKDDQEFYRHGLTQLNAHCVKAYGKPFRRITPAQQDETITALEHGKLDDFAWPASQAFFNTVRRHTMEGMFADPIYGGNRDFAGWRLVGFPGAQPQFTPEDMRSTEAFTREGIVGLQARSKGRPG